MSSRLTVVLVPAAFLLGLLTFLDSRSQSIVSRSTRSNRDANTPIVALRGQPLAEYEEALPDGARVRIGSTRFRHPRGIGEWNVQVAGRYVVITEHNNIVLTDAATGKRVWTERVSFGPRIPDCLSITTSPDGRRFAAWDSGRDSARLFARVWDVLPDPDRPLRPACTLTLPDDLESLWVNQLVFPSNSQEVLLLAKGIHAFDARSGEHVRYVPVENSIIAIDQRGKRFLTSSDYNPLTGRGYRGGLYRSPTYRFHMPSQSDEAKRLARLNRDWADRCNSGQRPITLMVVDAQTRKAVLNLTTFRDPAEPMQHLDLSPDGRYLSYESNDEVLVFDVDRERQVLAIPIRRDDSGDYRKQISDSWFSGDSRRLCVAYRDDCECCYDLDTGRAVPLQSEVLQRHGCFYSHWQGVVSKHGVIVPTGKSPLPPGYAGTVIDFLPNDGLLAIGDATGRVDVWRPDGRLVKTPRVAGKGITAVAFSPDGKQLATCDKSRTVRVWRSGNWRQTHAFDVPADSDYLCPDRLAFSPDGSRLLVSEGDILALWDLNKRKWLWDRAGYGRDGGHSSPSFTPDGSEILAECQSNWIDAATGEDAANCDRHRKLSAELPFVSPICSLNDCSSMALSPAGSHVALVNGERLLQLWEVASDGRVRSFPESKTCEKRRGLLRFSPDGHRLATCDNSGHAHVWEVATGQLAFTLNYPDGDIANVFFTKDGRSIITSNHREVIVWDLKPEPGAEKNAWANLMHEAPKAEQARRALLADPPATVQLLRERLRPASPLNPAEVNDWIQQLDARHFRTREQAAARLRAGGRRVLPILKKANLTSEEGRTRLAGLIRDLSAGLTPIERREVRCIELLEQIDTPAARDLIGQLAKGDPLAVLTEEAQKAARRNPAAARQLPPQAERPTRPPGIKPRRSATSAATSRS